MRVCDTVKNRRWWQTWGAWIFAAAIVATVVASIVYASQEELAHGPAR